MGQMILHRPRLQTPGQQTRVVPVRPAADPASAARGILLALALSSVLWAGIALLVPRLW